MQAETSEPVTVDTLLSVALDQVNMLAEDRARVVQIVGGECKVQQLCDMVNLMEGRYKVMELSKEYDIKIGVASSIVTLLRKNRLLDA
jgi:3-deoxy-D-manno-octulosonate 8-phosphate phosphatase KdsC-like HAD superfamily phosphatase